MRKATPLSIAAVAAIVTAIAACSSGAGSASTTAETTSQSISTTAETSSESVADLTQSESSHEVNTAIVHDSMGSDSEPGDDDTSQDDADSGAPDNEGAPGNETEQGESPTSSGQSGVSPEVQNAVGSAKSYLKFSAFSKKGLIQQLSSEAGEGFDKAVATKAVNQLDVDWKEQAVKAAKSYLDFSSFSKKGLIEQLESDAGDQYTHDQAVYGANKAYGGSKQSEGSGQSGVSPEVQNAVGSAKSYLKFSAFSKKGLIQQLSSEAGEGFDKAVATKAVNQLDVDWKEQAVKAAKSYLDFSSFSKKGLIEQLESDAGDQYTHDQAVYGANKAYGG